VKSYQNLLMLQNLYRLKAVGYEYIDPVTINVRDDQTLPSEHSALHDMIASCHLCDLSKSRSQAMAGTGNPDAEVMIVDASVSMAEDESNSYFSGRSGSSLRKMIENVLQIPAASVYLTHAVKCKPLGSNQPSPSEWDSCKPYLFKQIELINPKVIVALGPDAYARLTGDTTPFEQVRGQKVAFGAQQVVAIYHPQYLLRNPSLKQVTLHDLHTIKSCL
jgi:uracil-DNA glycosylase